MTTVTIEVTAEDIAKGRRDSSRSCPVARAVRRALRRRGIDVFDDEMWLDGATRVPFPGEAGRFIRAFDGHRDVEPITFTVEVPA